MINVANLPRFLRQMLGIAAAVLLVSATQRAEALSPVNPTMSVAKVASDTLILVRGGHGGGGHGGGGGHAGGGYHGGGGAAFHGGALHAGGGGGHFVAPLAFHHRHFGPRFYGYAPSYYPAYYYAPHRYCRIVHTYYGPRRICRYRPWHHHWYPHRRHHHWRGYY